jgi:uncharacterized protein
MSSPIVHLELSTQNASAAKDFYNKLFGWEFVDHDKGNMIYSTFQPSSGPGGGIFSMPELPTFWLAYVAVEDINAATERAVSLGASIHRGPVEIPHVGWITIFADPTGAPIGIFQPKPTLTM